MLRSSAVGFALLCFGSFLHGSEGLDIPALTAKANVGDALAAFQLGHAYYRGTHVAKDCAQAKAWYQKAADLNNVDALTALGICFLDSSCAQPDGAKAFSCFSKAAEQGNADGQNNLGVSYLIGTGVAADQPRAVAWFQRSASQGWSEAQFNLGVCCANGLGVAKDLDQARSWFAKARRRNKSRSWFARLLRMGGNKPDSLAVANRAQQVLAAPASLKEWGLVRNWFTLGI